jgi:hypothetical protein
MNIGTSAIPKNGITVFAIIAGFTASTVAFAVPLPLGGTVSTPGTTSAARPELAGAVVYSNSQAFTIVNSGGTVIATGTLQDIVVRESVTKTLDFYHRMINDTTSRGAITGIRRTDYSPVKTDVDFRTDSLGTVGSYKAFRSATGNIVQFFYTGNNIIPPGFQSHSAFIRTNATQFVVKGTASITAALPTGLAGATSLVVSEPDPSSATSTYHFYTLGASDLTSAKVMNIASRQKLTPTRNVNSDSRLLTFADVNGKVRMIGDLNQGTMEMFPDVKQFSQLPAPDARTASGISSDFLSANLLLPAVRTGKVVPAPTIALADGSVSIAAGATVPTATNPMDIMRTFNYVHQVDDLPVVGPKSMLSVDVAAPGAVGVTRSMRDLAPVDVPVAWKPFDDANNEFAKMRNAVLIGLLRSDPKTTLSLPTSDLIYFEQGGKYAQPVYRFQLKVTSSRGAVSGQTFYVPATTNSPEQIVNTPINANQPQALTPPATTAASSDIQLTSHGTGVPIKYGIYVVRNDNRFLQDAWNFHVNLDATNSIYSLFGFPWYAPVVFNQYYWDYPWLWENDPADGISDHSASYVGANHVVLYEGHGAPWEVTTYSNCCDLIDYRTLPGYGGLNGKSGKTAYIVWHTCDSIPAPGDAYGGFYTSPHGPFDIWFNVFKGLRGTYGARTTVDIYDNAGPAFAFSTGLGVPNLSAWLHAEANAVTGHHDNWDMGCAVLLSGHENDCIYDITPGNIPGSLTMYWQHP